MSDVLSWFVNRTIATKIAIGFGLVVSIGLIVGANAYDKLARIETAGDWTLHTYQVLGESRALQAAVLARESEAAAAPDGADTAPKPRGDADIAARLRRLLDLTVDNPSQQARLSDLAALIDGWRTVPRGASGSKHGQELLARILAVLNAIDGEEQRLLVLRTDARNAAFSTAYLVTTFGPMIALLVAGLLGWLLHRTIARPITHATDAMRKLAGGDTAVTLPSTRRNDEIGAMGRALEVFRTDMLDAKRLRAEQQETRLRATRDRATLMASMADRFEEVVGGIVQAVSTSSQEMQTSAASLLDLAEGTTGAVKSVAEATRRTSATMQDVAVDTRHLADSVGEINMRMAYSAEVAHQAVAEADRTTHTIEGLSLTAKRIGAIVDLINDVARQTNLLALNATIEAARAGDAGRGFAVVATEVKTLADQTARATQDIRHQIEAMQDAAAGSVAAIGEISRTIGEMARVTGEITTAVEVQGEAARDMMRGTQETARLTAAVSSQLDTVSDGAVTTGTAATNLLSAANLLARQSTVLREETRRFATSVRGK